MKRQFLEGLGLEKDAIDKIMAENGSDIESARNSEKGKFDAERTALQGQINDLQGQVSQRDTDLSALNEKLTAAQTDAGKLTEAQAALTGLQTKYDTERQQWQEKSAQQAYEFMVRERANGIRFSSTAAKKEFVRDAIGKKFQVDGDTLLGFEDYVSKYKAADPGAFQAEDPEPEPEPQTPPPPKPDIVLPPSGPKSTPDGSGFNFHFSGVRPMPQE